MSELTGLFAKSPQTPPHRFAHVAMNTNYEVMIASGDGKYAEAAAWEAFQEVDRLELLLSRFNSASEISNINALRTGQGIRVSTDTFACLAVADRIWTQTRGAFDVTIGPLRDCWRDSTGRPRTPTPEELTAARAATGMEQLCLDEQASSVMVLKDPVRIDLGAIGKGYAVDRMVALLRDWSITSALVQSGESTVYAIGTAPGEESWPLPLRNPAAPGRLLCTVQLSNAALSASGIAHQGAHIVDPRSGQLVSRPGAFSTAPTATEADALSTAFMVMSAEEVREYCQNFPPVSAILPAEEAEGAPRVYGPVAWARA